MTDRPTRWIYFFMLVQAVGIVAMWSWPHMPLNAASFVWGTALIALFPGNFLSSILIEKLLWTSGLSLTTMSLIETPLLVAINWALWFAVVAAFRRLFGRRAY